MPDASYDAVIIGGGHNGLCLAAYLARTGQKVGVFERRHDEGGGAHTEEATVPGFWHNLHAQYMEFIDYMPFYHDFDLPSFGARMIKPEAQVGIAFADGRPPLVIYTPDREKETHRSIAQFSKHDADVFNEIRRKVMASDRYLAALLYTPADEARVEDRSAIVGRLVEMWTGLGFKLNELRKTPKVLIDELFESTELRAVLYRQCPEWGANLHSSAGLGFVLSVIWLCGIHYMSVGGTHTLAHAMASACLREGVDLRYNSAVRSILTQNGRATGIQLEDGREIEAKIIASNADPRTTFMQLLGWDRLSAFRRERLANWRFGPEHVLATPSFALHSAPDYRSAKHDPAINRCFYTIVGYENHEQVSEYILQAYGGRIPERPAAGTWVNSLWDPSQAPPGKHAMNGWFFFPGTSCLSESDWDQVRASYNGRFLDLWGQYAPNMTRENVIADRLYVPLDIEKKIGMPEGDFSHGRPGSGFNLETRTARTHIYRTETEGLYMCGASAGGGGISAAAGYNAFKVIAQDYGLPEIWKRDDRIY
jgi:phytoene dehydrogenase-like protein